jgi:hypothetical protein
MIRSRDEFREARDLWKQAGNVPPPGGCSACPGPGDLASYLDGAMRGAQRDAIEEHFRFCPSCVEAVAGVRALLRAGPSPVSAAVFERAKGLVAESAAVARESSGVAALRRFFSLMRTSAAWAAAAALIVAACAAGFLMGQETSAPAPLAGEPAQVTNGAQDPVLAEFSRLEETYLRGNLS